MKYDYRQAIRHPYVQCVLGGTAIALLTVAGLQLHFRPMLAALLYLIVVVLTSLSGNRSSSVVLSLIAVGCLDYFFIPPLLGVSLTDIVELIAFLTTSLVITHLMSSLKMSLKGVRALTSELRLVVDTVPALIFSARANGSCDFLSQRWLGYTGLVKGDGLGWGWTTAVHPDDRVPFVDIWKAVVAANGSLDTEARLRRADGAYRWFRIRAVPLRDEQGRIAKWYGSASDIEEQRRAAVALREKAGLLDLTHDTVFVRDMNDTITFWNRGAEELYGWKKEEAIGRVSHDLTRTVFPASLEEITATLVRSGRWEGELVHTKRDGGQIIVASRWALQYDEQGRPVATLETNNDVTAAHDARAVLERAFDEIRKLKDQLYRENLALKDEVDQASMFEEIVGSSDALRRVLTHVTKVAPTDSTVLITGETGTGKELVARAIHKRSSRAGRAFVSVNCAAIPGSLIASELFGHEKGAFTGAIQRHLGRFELADGGTIFLDEIGELAPDIQVALLRVLQERTFERVGGGKPVAVDVRVLAATNRDLKAAAEAGTFRSDLFYRLNVFPIEVPPLRERVEDITLLVEYFTARYASRAGKKIRKIETRTLEALRASHWPGNVRELQNVIERAVILSDGDFLSVDEGWLSRDPPAQAERRALSGLLKTHEREMIEAALAETKGRVSGSSGAAAKLGMPPSTLESKIRTLNISKHRFKKNY